MIDSGLSIPVMPIALFHLKQFFWFNVWPVVVGFTTILCYQIYMRTGLTGARSKTLVFALSSAASMLALFGWSTIVHTARMIPLYGCGVGLASVLASQVYAVTLSRRTRLQIPFPSIIWRSDEAAVQKIRRLMAAPPLS